jgi:hypothetical protein
MTKPELTLKKAKETAVKREFRASDFLTPEQLDEVHISNAKGKKTASFDEVDAYIAEILARFGYDTYVAWKIGEIKEDEMVRYIEAERVREVSRRLMLENIIVASVAGANNPTKNGQPPKSLKTAVKMLKSEENRAKGKK